MADNDLKDQLSGLFSDVVPEPEPEVEEEDLEAPLQEEEQLVSGLLQGESAAAAAPPDLVPEVAPPVVDEEKVARQSVVSRGGPFAWQFTIGKRQIGVLNVLLYGLVLVGAVYFLSFLFRMVWQEEPVHWSSFLWHLVVYALIVVIVLWVFNSSLTRELQRMDAKRHEAIRSQAALAQQVRRLAVANTKLQKQTLQLQTVAQVSVGFSSVLDLDDLLRETVNLILTQFDLYYVGIYLVDESRRWATLRAGTGEAGAQMLAQGHRYALDKSSIVGRCVLGGHARIALDAVSAQARMLSGEITTDVDGDEDVPLEDIVDIVELNSLLPRTRSQMVLPLLSPGQVIGVLDIHSAEREAFSEEDILVLQTIVDQAAVAIENAYTFQEAQDRLEELRRQHQREQRARLAPGDVAALYERTESEEKSLSSQRLPELEQVLSQEEIVVRPGKVEGAGGAALVTPIKLRGEIIGALGLQEIHNGRQWTDDEVALVEAVADQMALAIENARLLEATRRRAEQERLTADITAQVRAHSDVDNILRTAIRELGRALRASEGTIQLEVQDGVEPVLESVERSDDEDAVDQSAGGDLG